MKTLTKVQNGFYGSEEETVLVIDDNAFIVQSQAILENQDWVTMDVDNLNESFEFLGDRLSEDLMVEYYDIFALIYASLCCKAIKRLKVDASVDSCSGLLIDNIRELRENLDVDEFEDLSNQIGYVCKIYDDYYHSYWDAEDLYNKLKTINKSSLDSNSPDIWLMIEY